MNSRSFFIILYWINVSSALVADWRIDLILIVIFTHFGGLLWGLIYDSQGEGHCCGDGKLGVMMTNLVFCLIGAILWIIYFFLDLFSRAFNTFFVYLIGLFFFASIIGLVCISMTSACDIMARSSTQTHVPSKSVHRYGAMIFMFGLGMAFNAAIYQAFVTAAPIDNDG
jgi:hypothetical protein